MRITRTNGHYKLSILEGATVCRWFRIFCGIAFLAVYATNAASGAWNFSSKRKPSDSAGFVIELAATEADVLRAVNSIVEDPVIRGTFVYDKEKTLTGATPAKSSPYFASVQQPGHVFYKVLNGALAPRHFRDSTDIGTITVRYAVQSVDEAKTRLRIDAIFVQEGRRVVHRSDGSVEASEFKEIQNRLSNIQSATQRSTNNVFLNPLSQGGNDPSALSGVYRRGYLEDGHSPVRTCSYVRM